MKVDNLLIAGLLYLSMPEAGMGQPLVDGGFDSGVDGWAATTDPTKGTLSWAMGMGNPPGSLKIEGTQKASTEECLLTTVFNMEWSADVFRVSTSEPYPQQCAMTITWYTNPDCTGDRVLLLGDRGPPAAREFDEWERVLFEVPSLFPYAKSFKPSFSAETSPSGGGVCFYDSASLIIVRAPAPDITEVPALDRYGLLLLAMTLGVAALSVLRRFRG